MSDCPYRPAWTIGHHTRTLLAISLPCMAIIYLVSYPSFDNRHVNLLWFPGYFFLTLLLFSGSTLYFSQRR